MMSSDTTQDVTLNDNDDSIMLVYLTQAQVQQNTVPVVGVEFERTETKTSNSNTTVDNQCYWKHANRRSVRLRKLNVYCCKSFNEMSTFLF